MGVVDRINNTIQLMQRSSEVLRADRELLALPVLSAVATMATTALFLVPLVSSGAAMRLSTVGASPAVLVAFFALYVTLAFITIFFNAALVHAANERLAGGDPTLGSAIGGAAAHLGPIVIWALISATVSSIVNAIERRSGIVGSVISTIIGVAWALATFFVIPIMVIEGGSPVEAIKRSGALVRTTWGEQVASTFGFGLLGFIASLPGILLVVLGIGTGSLAGLVVLVTSGLLWLIAVNITIQALSAVFRTALYRYAAEPPSRPGGRPGTGVSPTAGWSTPALGTAPQPAGSAAPNFFDAQTLRSAFRRP